jgi:hypothetical protein
MSSESTRMKGADDSGVSWYAASRTDLTIACRAKLEALSLLQRWKSQLGCEFSFPAPSDIS